MKEIELRAFVFEVFANNPAKYHKVVVVLLELLVVVVVVIAVF